MSTRPRRSASQPSSKARAQLLARVPFLAALPDPDRVSLASAVSTRRFSRGDIIFDKGEPGHSLFIIERGAVRIYVPSASGTDLTLAVMGPGDFFGDLSLLDEGPRSASAAAISDSVTLVLDRHDFTELLRSRPDAAMAVLAVVARRLREADQTASDLAFLDAGGRVARKLLELASAHGVEREDGILLNISMTQEELANMIGLTRESVNRNLSNFRRLGLISREGRRVVVRDPEALRGYYE